MRDCCENLPLKWKSLFGEPEIVLPKPKRCSSFFAIKERFESRVRVKMIMDKVALTWYALCVLHVSVQYEDYGSHLSTKKKKKKKIGTGPCGKIVHCAFQ